MRPSFCTGLLILHINFAYCAFISERYVVPEPTIEVFSPKGFQVSIPHEDGVDLFAFHGNINQPLEDLSAGQFSRDILKRRGDRWVFEDRQAKLREGDVIYYWLFVIKNRLGYRLDDGMFTIRSQDIIPLPQPTNNHDEASPSQDDIESNNAVDPPKKSNIPCLIKRNLTNAMDSLKQEVEAMGEINNILKDLVAKDDNASRQLKFEGVLPPYDDAAYTAQVIISEKLGVSISVVDASWDAKRRIVFHVASLNHKINLIRKAKEKLQNSKIRLIY